MPLGPLVGSTDGVSSTHLMLPSDVLGLVARTPRGENWVMSTAAVNVKEDGPPFAVVRYVGGGVFVRPTSESLTPPSHVSFLVVEVPLGFQTTSGPFILRLVSPFALGFHGDSVLAAELYCSY